MTKIQWTEKTWNPVRGCVKISPGCKHCYAETFAERFRGVAGHPYEQGFDLRLVPEKLREPLRWKSPQMVFVNSMSDLYQIGVPRSYIAKVFAVMFVARWHTFQVLTKRGEIMREILGSKDFRRALDDEIFALTTERGCYDWPLPNVWLGVSVENQKYADERIPQLLETPAAVRFISAEPLLGPIDLDSEEAGHVHALGCGDRNHSPEIGTCKGLDWVICGGESGPGARPFDLAWAEALLEQCRGAGVPFFMKQVGSASLDPGCNHPMLNGVLWPGKECSPDLKNQIWRCGVCGGLEGLRDRKGGDPLEWPDRLRVREFPKARPA